VMGRPVEGAARWVAGRTSRRSFLGRLGRTAVLVAGGPTLAGMLTHQAEARVCGQTGVSDRCPTFDCTGPGSVWGWCWYTSPGCCANGGLKKICDCCTAGYPNVHGYCPSGTNVRCIVESCYADPRLSPVPTARLDTDGPVDAALRVARLRFPDGGAPSVVVGDASDPVSAAIAAGVAGVLGAPLLVTSPGALDRGVADELDRLEPPEVVVCGPALAPTITGYVRAIGFAVRELGTEGDLAAASLDAARWIMGNGGTPRAVCVATTGASAAVAPAAGAVALLARCPVVVGAAAARDLGAPVTYVVGPEAAGDVPNAHSFGSATAAALSRELASLAVEGLGVGAVPVTLVPDGQPGLAAGVAGLGTLVLYHAPGRFDPDVQAWTINHQPHLRHGFAAGTAAIGALDTAGYYWLQSALNRFDAHLLVGVGGQGLPVYSQPLAEREIGRARLAGLPPADSGAGHWIARANPDRSP
jgi:hypothetical protein